MLETKAVFRRKESEIESTNCVVDKVIRLPGDAFDYFSRNLLQDWDFIRDNPIKIIVDTQGRYHCLLVVGEGRRDGVLVNSEGSDYARYSALIPNVESFLALEQYPALATLNQKLTTIVDYITGQIGADAYVDINDRLRSTVDLDSLDSMFGIEINETLFNTITDMLAQRSEIEDFEIDNNELILYSKPDVKVLSEAFSDLTVTRMDMYAYGYSYEGMIPLRKERASELFDNNLEVYLLYQDDTEGAAESREDILAHDGLFGIGDPALEIIERTASIEVFILNRERYENGEAVGEWLTLPADADTLHGLLERIGINRPSESAFTVTAARLPDYLCDRVSKYDSLDELNMLESFMKDMEDFEFDKLQAILGSGVHDIGSGTTAIINALCDENFDAFRMIDAADYGALGRYWEDELHDKPEDISLEEYGRQIVADEKGKFTEQGYIYFRYKELLPEYTGVVPDEYQIVSAALRGLISKSQEHCGPDEKPSVLDKIRTSRSAPRTPKDKAARQSKKDKGGTEL